MKSLYLRAFGKPTTAPELIETDVNPMTADVLLRGFVDLRPGDWVGHTAGNSAVGRCLITLAKQAGCRTLSVVPSGPATPMGALVARRLLTGPWLAPPEQLAVSPAATASSATCRAEAVNTLGRYEMPRSAA